MRPSATAGTGLGTLIDDGCAAAEAFGDALRQEFEALEAGDVEALSAAAAGKQDCLAALEALESRRRALLAGQGHDDDAAGMDRLIEAAGDAALATRWRRYLELAGECRKSNMRNGAIIRLRRQQATSALAALSGSAPPTYGPQGDGGRLTGSRPIARA